MVGARIMHGYQHGKVLQEGGRHGPAQANGSRKEGDQIKYAVVGVGKAYVRSLLLILSRNIAHLFKVPSCANSTWNIPLLSAIASMTSAFTAADCCSLSSLAGVCDNNLL